jgi:3-hydroxyacyl-CoA dehydrogenase
MNGHSFTDGQQEKRMGRRIRKVAVLGAGVMGSGIAGHLANAGVRCVLLDIVPPNPGPADDVSSAAFRNRFAASAVDRMLKAKPAPLFRAAAKDLIEVGNFEDHLNKVSDCDWIIEVVKEDLTVKQALFEKLEALRQPQAIVSSNTSGLSVASMLNGRSASFRQHFLVTHFFNPVRYMKLLELVAGPETEAWVIELIHAFGEEKLGKGIVYGKDTTNFIANRIGVYGMMKTMSTMLEMGLGVEDVDAIFGPALGRPKSAVFRTADLVGLDTFAHVAKNCWDTLPDDEERSVFQMPEFVSALIAAGRLGDKSGAGFYKKVRGESGSDILVLNPATGEYQAKTSPRWDTIGKARKAKDLRGKIQAMLAGEDQAAELARRVTLAVLAYAARRIPEIADDVVNIDRGMRWGFGWDVGPFETWDAIGVERGVAMMTKLGIDVPQWVTAMLASGRTSFYGVDGVNDTFWDIGSAKAHPVPESRRAVRVDVIRRTDKKVASNAGATLWDMGDGIALLEFHTKMNSIDDQVIKMMHLAVDKSEADFRGLVIGNDGGNFSAGANIMALLMGAKMGRWDDIRSMITGFQQANQRMRYSSVPVVSAPYGLTLGGGAEAAMGANAIQASAELYMGLVEVGVGVIPGGSGTLQMLRNVFGAYATDAQFDPTPFLARAFMNIGTAKVSMSAEEALELGFLQPGDSISMNRDFLLSDAKAKAIGMAESGFRPPRALGFRLPGRSGKATIDMMLYNMELNGQVSAHDRLIGSKLAGVLTGGDASPGALVSEERLLELEAEAFLSLTGEEKTQARLAYMLENGKPLRN